MNGLVVYKSNTGFTRRYAQYIAKALDCEALPLYRIGDAMLKDVDFVVFGGWVMGGRVNGLDAFRRQCDTNAVYFAVGATAYSNQLQEKLQKQNKLESDPFFYFEGGLNRDKLGFMHRSMLKMAAAQLPCQEDFDHTDLHEADELIEYCKTKNFHKNFMKAVC